MKVETKRWIKRAEEDLDTAKILFNNKKFEGAAFYCQQAAEKALKAFSLEKTNTLRKIHDLVELGKEAGIPEEILTRLKELTLAYVYSRYPDVNQVINLKRRVSEFLKTSEETIRWVKKNL